MSDTAFSRFVFGRRGELLAIPALALAIFGRPDVESMQLGLPIALLGELVRCWAVGYSGVTTRGDEVEAPALVTNGPYAHVRNPLYVGNFITAAGFAIAFTGRNDGSLRALLIVGGLATMFAVYAVIVPHEEGFLRGKFGAPYEQYLQDVPRLIPRLTPAGSRMGTYDASVIAKAETRTFISFGVMLALLLLKAR
jgi:protein-S-isoprenylcysteine O-methyltransferase Ste14